MVISCRLFPEGWVIVQFLRLNLDNPFGMQMALDVGVTKIIVKSDSLDAVRLLDDFLSTPS